MTLTHRQHPAARAAVRLPGLVVAALCAATLAGAVPALAADASPAPAPAASSVVLSGPTGSRIATPIADGAAPPDPATLVPLDTGGREPRLTIGVLGGDAEGFASWTVDAVPAADPGADPVDLIGGVAEVPVPVFDVPAPDPGDWLLTAVTTGREPATTGTWAWRVVVPDRSLPETPAAPDAVLWAGGRTAIAERGSGCYVGTCGDVGGVPPDASLPGVELARPDEPITLTLSDGSDLVVVRAVAVPIGGRNASHAPETILLEGPLAAPVHVVLVPPPPGSGMWRVELQLTYSDLRGDGSFLARVTVP